MSRFALAKSIMLFAALLAAMYSASVDENAADFCFWLDHETGPPIY